MWYVERLAEIHAQHVESAQREIEPPLPVKQPELKMWNFLSDREFIGMFLGKGSDIVLPGEKPQVSKIIPTWEFMIIEPEAYAGQQYVVPQWSALDLADDHFLGFSKEIPRDGSEYLLRYLGRAGVSENDSGTVLMKIFKRGKS